MQTTQIKCQCEGQGHVLQEQRVEGKREANHCGAGHGRKEHQSNKASKGPTILHGLNRRGYALDLWAVLKDKEVEEVKERRKSWQVCTQAYK